MTFNEMLLIGVAGTACSTILVILAYFGDRMHKSMDSLRDMVSGLKDMLDEKLTGVTHSLTSIEKDIRADISEHDRRISVIETIVDRRGSIYRQNRGASFRDE